MARKPKGSHRAYEEGIIRAYKERRPRVSRKASQARKRRSLSESRLITILGPGTG